MNLSIFKALSGYIVESTEDFTAFEKRFVLSTCLVLAFSALFGTILNIFLDFSLNNIILAGITTLVYSGLYIYGRQTRNLEMLKWLISLISLVVINVFWVLNYNSRGPVIYLFVVYFSLLLFIWNRKQLIVLFFLVLVNIVTLFFIEYYYSGQLPEYPSEMARIIDVYTGLIIFFSIIFIFTTAAKNNYINQFKKAKESDRLKSAFLANMSHEIRTPLNAIYGISSLIANESFSRDEIKNYTNIIHENSQYLTRLIEDMIDISKLETDQFSLKFRPTLIEPIFSHLYENFREEIERKEKDIALEVSVPDRKRTIDTDPTRLEQVFNNLLNNAVKFTHEGRIHFGYYTNKDYLTFFVEDTGAGIKKENYEKIFERFIKIETSEEEVHRGTGIGLFLCKEIIHMMGGKIWLESEWGKGSTFYFTIPLSKNPVKNNASSSVTQNEYSYREK